MRLIFPFYSSNEGLSLLKIKVVHKLNVRQGNLK